jgi:hypothetical protein
MRALETQSKDTIVNWCVDYAEARVLPIYAAEYPSDSRVHVALGAAREYLAGHIKLPLAKAIAYCSCRDAAREAEDHPAARVAVQACGQAALTAHTPLHSIGMIFYGTAAIAYSRAGMGECGELYHRIAAAECAKAETALRAVSVRNEAHPAQLAWWKNSVFGRRDAAAHGGRDGFSHTEGGLKRL